MEMVFWILDFGFWRLAFFLRARAALAFTTHHDLRGTYLGCSGSLGISATGSDLRGSFGCVWRLLFPKPLPKNFFTNGGIFSCFVLLLFFGPRRAFYIGVRFISMRERSLALLLLMCSCLRARRSGTLVGRIVPACRLRGARVILPSCVDVSSIKARAHVVDFSWRQRRRHVLWRVPSIIPRRTSPS